MARTLKPETIIKNQMQSYINQYGFDKNVETNTDGNRIFIDTPNRFCSCGFIRVVFANGENWLASLSEKNLGKVCAPKRQKHLENFFSK